MPATARHEGAAMSIQDIRDLDERPRHDGRGTSRWRRRRQQRERARHLSDRLQRHPRVDGGGVELLVPERSRGIMRTFYVIEIESSAAWNPMLTGATLSAAVDIRPCPPP